MSMSLEKKRQIQGCMFDMLVAMDPTVGDIVELGMGLCWMALMELHKGDQKLAADSMREALDQVLDQLPKIARAPMGVVNGGKLN